MLSLIIVQVYLDPLEFLRYYSYSLERSSPIQPIQQKNKYKGSNPIIALKIIPCQVGLFSALLIIDLITHIDKTITAIHATIEKRIINISLIISTSIKKIKRHSTIKKRFYLFLFFLLLQR